MIVPTNRLLIFYAVTLPPLTLFPILEPTAVTPVVAAAVALAGIALGDALFAPLRLKAIGVSLPEAVRMARDREGEIEIRLTHACKKERTLRLGLPFPSEISSPQEDLLAVLPEGAERASVVWPCTPLSRGRFPLTQCCLETKSPLGLWAFRGTRDVACELRVYPNLSQERNSLAALFLNRGGYGIHARRQFGKGREFEKLREYIPGDGFDEIHWKATAKRRHPITKVFQIERTQEVYVVVDASRLSARPSAVDKDPVPGGQHVEPHGYSQWHPISRPSGATSRPNVGAFIQPGSKPGWPSAAGVTNGSDTCLERFIAAALVVGLAAQKQGDLFGLLTFSDSVHTFLRARGGKSHYGLCREEVFNLHPRMANPDFEELSTFIRLHLRRRALIILLTSLDDPVLAESFTRAIELVGRHHLVMVNMLRPAGARPIFSNPGLASSEEIYAELSGHLLWHHLREIERSLARRGVHFSLLDHERLCVDLVSQYMTVKQRQLL